MLTEKEIFNAIAIAIINVLPKGQQFKKVVLEIKRLPGNIGFTGYYLTQEEHKKWIDIFKFTLNPDYIEDLYIITQTRYPIHKEWNRAIYELFLEGKMAIEYIFDEELQNEVDRLNSDVSSPKNSTF